MTILFLFLHKLKQSKEVFLGVLINLEHPDHNFRHTQNYFVLLNIV